jgi:hypothetical protein
VRLFDVQSTAALSISRQSVDRLITDKRLDAIVIRAGRRKRLVRISDVALKNF